MRGTGLGFGLVHLRREAMGRGAQVCGHRAGSDGHLGRRWGVLLARGLVGACGRIPAGQEPQNNGVSQGIRRAPRLVLPGEVSVFARAIRVTRQGHTIPVGQSFFLESELPDVIQDLVQALSGDVLHRVIANAVVLAIVEDADDVGVVQSGRRAGLGVESAEVVRVVAILRMHHFERHMAAERLANRFVNHAHASLAEVAEDPVVAQLRGKAAVSGRYRLGQQPITLLPRRLELFHQSERGKQLADVVGMFGVALDVLA